MKRFLLALGFIAAMSSFVPANAKVNVSVNIGLQPAWGPVGYDYARYYYFPDIDIYYNVNAAQFVYWDGRVWVSARYLPYRYSNYDLYPMYKVVINDRDPWRYNDRYRRQYAHYRGYRNQPIIMNSHDRRYRDSRNNRVNWVDSNRRPSNDRYPSNNHRPNNSGKHSNSDRRPNNQNNNNSYNHNSSNNNRPNSQSNQNGRYSSERNNTSRNSTSREDNKGNNKRGDVVTSRGASNRDTQRTTASRNSSGSDKHSSSKKSTRASSNTSAKTRN